MKTAIANMMGMEIVRGSRVCRPWNKREAGSVLAFSAERNEIEVQLDDHMGRVCGPIIHHGSANWERVPDIQAPGAAWINGYGTPIRSDCPECHGDGMSRPVEDGYCCVTCQVRHAEAQRRDEEEDEEEPDHYDETDMLLDGIL